jgi:UDP-glucose 4-epimerase
MILITGGAGYIGSHAAKQLASQGYSPLVFDSLEHGHRESGRWGKLIEGDLADTVLLRKTFKTYPISAVMHFAGYAYVGESVLNPAKYYQNNVCNTLKLLQTMREASVNKIIFSSSCATYGIPSSLPITEEHQQKPVNPYGNSKLVVETMLCDFAKAYDLNYVILRYFNAAGADPECEIGEWHEPETHLIPLVLDAAFGKREFVRVFGTDYDTPDGTCIRDYIHVSDLADAHILALKYLMADKPSIALNLSNGLGFSVRQVIATVEQITGKKVPFVEEARRDGDPPILVGSSEKAQNILGWRPHITSLPEIVATASKWFARMEISPSSTNSALK